jgi:hypothetical protein
VYNQGASVAESFGYFEDSKCNTMALIRRVSNLEYLQDMHSWLVWLPSGLGGSHQTYKVILGNSNHFQQFGFNEEDTRVRNNLELPPGVSDSVQQELEQMPDRQIFDFLVHFYVSEVNW